MAPTPMSPDSPDAFSSRDAFWNQDTMIPEYGRMLFNGATCPRNESDLLRCPILPLPPVTGQHLKYLQVQRGENSNKELKARARSLPLHGLFLDTSYSSHGIAKLLSPCSRDHENINHLP